MGINLLKDKLTKGNWGFLVVYGLSEGAFTVFEVSTYWEGDRIMGFGELLRDILYVNLGEFEGGVGFDS